MEKAEVRKSIRDLKRAVSPEEKLRRSEGIMRQVESLPAFQQARVVLLYWSMADEVQTHDFVNRWYKDKVLLLPCVDGDDLRLRQYTGPECLVAGEQFGIGEPADHDPAGAPIPEFTNLDRVELIIVPGVAFDRQHNRMGRGRGFYDRMLKSTPNAIKVGVAFDFQLLDEIPTEEFDMKMDMVIAESQII
ncbi:MAG: 5-formyltetrahydrofolate cyclo-ligase [Bacteroidales bacterium]|nr:5-formyltetrahydrofolate cyclo-ligase [Bacteroidales bacterium]